MTPKERAAMQQALEALEELHYSSGTAKADQLFYSAFAALREALQQPVSQEPVDEALRLAEETLQVWKEYCFDWPGINDHLWVNKDEEALQAVRAARAQPVSQEPEVWYCPDCGTLSEAQVKCCPDWIRSRKVPKNFALTCRDTFNRLADYTAPQPELNLNCKSVQKRLATVWGYVKAEQAEQEPFDMDDHPPHRLCECRKCMEYFTPLPDCDAFAASGKPIAEQTNTQFMEGYRIGLAEMREKCAKVCDDKHDYMCSRAAAAIRAIKFEGDTGFRPVSEMVAEHKQDPKKAAAIEKAKMRKAEQKPVAVVEITYGREPECYVTGNIDDFPEGVFKLYAAPVRTKDLTDDEIGSIYEKHHALGGCWTDGFAYERAVIAAHKEKNK